MTQTGMALSARLAALAAAAFWAALPANAGAQGTAATDRASLEALFDATGGPGWADSTNWKTSAPLVEWHGVTTDAAGRVAQLHLGRNGLAGSVPPELGSLVHLEELHLGENDLGGPIPVELGKLVNLKWLSLELNNLSGPIPGELGSWVNIEGLLLGANDLGGPIPVELGKLVNLKWLSLDHNALSGPIPGELGSQVHLEELHLGWNGLTGPLPRRLIQLRRLARLDIDRTGACAPADTAFQEWLAAIDFSGVTCNRPPQPVEAIPAQALTESGPVVGVSMEAWFSDPDDDPLTYAASSSRAATVTALASGDTIWLVPGAPGAATVTVTASDPDGLSATQTMTVTTAPSAGPQSDREVLEVLYDGTGGPGWTNRQNWTTSAPLDQWYGVTTNADGRVVGVELRENGLAGPIPASLGHLASLEWLSLSGNDLIGPVPARLGNLVRLRSLDLHGNAFTGPLPGELGSLASLESLSLGGNELTGPVPARLGNLVRLGWLDLDGNAFTGPLPGELGSLVSLESLSLGGNELTGPVPARLGNLVQLRSLDLDGNAFTGPLPGELGSLASLESLFLGGNDLTGPLPAALGNLANLEALDLSHNWGLSGPLPPGLRLPRLEYLDIFLTQTCAPIAWQDRLVTIEFTGRLCETEPDVIIDVAVVYTRAARLAAGGAAEIEAAIDLMIAETNQAYAASTVHHRIALVARSEVQYTETGESLLDLGRLENPSDGYMDGVHALRDRVGADLVHLIVDEDKTDVGGLANIAGAFGLSIHNGGGLIFGHELGHNMGLLHDRYVDRGNLSSHPAYGYVNQRAFAAGAARSSRWRTIMSYGSQCEDAYVFDCSWLLRFSNPRQRYNGDPLGVPFGQGSGVTGPADAAAVLNATGPAVALWRDRPPGGNRPPAASDALPDRTTTLRGTFTVDASQAFVDPDGDPLTYTVSSSAPHVVAGQAVGARVTLTAVGEGTATIRVMATDRGGLSAAQTFTVTVSTTVTGPFTNDPIRPGVTPVRAVHFTELRARIEALRREMGLGRFVWTDPVLTVGVTPVRLVHLLELREALAAAYAAAGRAAPRWAAAAAAGEGTTLIRAAHLMELRAAVVALE